MKIRECTIGEYHTWLDFYLTWNCMKHQQVYIFDFDVQVYKIWKITNYSYARRYTFDLCIYIHCQALIFYFKISLIYWVFFFTLSTSYTMGPIRFISASSELIFYPQYGLFPILKHYEWLEQELIVRECHRSWFLLLLFLILLVYALIVDLIILLCSPHHNFCF